MEDDRARLTRFVEGFEKAFIITGKGTICCNRAARPLITAWFNDNKMLISIVSGVMFNDLVFHEPGYQQTDLVNLNHVLALNNYAAAHGAYMKYCTLLNRPVNSRYLPVSLLQAERQVDMDG